ncbi:DUF4913 domain-containing protein [Leifsonia aquatica]|uniref:DUF4913 domain-containing protein n=1 Tax=Leifsonia aquatica TaxID=144185 RepID=UPI00382CD5B4
MTDEPTTPDTTSSPDETAGQADLDAMIGAALSSGTIRDTAQAAATELVKKAVEQATRQATAKVFSEAQLQRIQEETSTVVKGIFPVPESADDPEQEQEGAASAQANYTALFLEWAKQFLPIIETANQQTEEHLWCTSWYLHPEAVARLVTLWLAWEEARTSDDQRSQSSWWIDHWDRHVPVLLSSRGPFRRCELAHSAPIVRLDYGNPPENIVLPRY